MAKIRIVPPGEISSKSLRAEDYVKKATAKGVTEKVWNADPELAGRLAQVGYRGLFDVASAEWGRCDNPTRKEIVTKLLRYVTLENLMDAFCDVMEQVGWDANNERSTFLEAVSLMLTNK